MGKSSNPQPTHSVLCSDSVVPSRSTSPRPSGLCSKAHPTKLACPLPVSTGSSTRPPSPSPLTSSLSSTPVSSCFEAGPESPESPLSPVSPVDEVFYDALDELPGLDHSQFGEPHSHKPVRINVLQVESEPEPAAKGRMGIAAGRNSRATTYYNAPPPPTSPASPAPPASPMPFGRGSSKTTVSSAGTYSLITPLAFQAQQDSARLRINAAPRKAAKKALLVGINYPYMGKDRLWYAAGDAARFEKSLKALGFQHDNIRLITDESDLTAPERSKLLDSIQWLVAGARAGDVLFFVFSGHCVKDQGLLTADKRFITQEMLHQYLVMRIPAGCELQIVFDCCSAAALIQLQYCVGRMAPPAAPSESTEPAAAACESEVNPPLAAELDCPAAQPRIESQRLEPLQASFHGFSAVAPASPISPDSTAQPRGELPHLEPLQASIHGLVAVAPPFPASPVPPAPAPAPITPAMVGQETFAPAPSNPVVSHRRGGVVAAPPVPTPTPVVSDVASALGAVAGQATGFVSSLFGRGQASAAPTTTPARPSTPAVPTRVGTPVSGRAAVSGDPRRGRQVVVEGDRAPDHFEERQGPFVQPAGKVMVWAGAGEGQQAFEAYGGVKHGIVTNAMCSALEACASANNMLTRRDFWRYLAGAIDKENAHRGERDAKKSLSDRQDPKLRVQHAELWVSQAGPLTSAASELDRPMIMI